MKTVDEVRRANFDLLLKEAGKAAELARRAEISRAYISQIVNNIPHPETGRPRRIDDKAARKLEEGMSKERGWMDKDHSRITSVTDLDGREGHLIALFRQMSEADRERLLLEAEELAKRPHSGRISPAHTPHFRKS